MAGDHDAYERLHLSRREFLAVAGAAVASSSLALAGMWILDSVGLWLNHEHHHWFRRVEAPPGRAP